MRFHKRVFVDLMIKMLGFGICIGIVFPFFTLLFGVDKSIALSPLFFLSCILAGILVGIMGLLIARVNIKFRLLKLISNMNNVNQSILDFQNNESIDNLDTDSFVIYEDSDDCFGMMADSFNTLVQTLIETLNSQKSHRNYLETLSENLDLKDLSSYALKKLMAFSKASAGSILIEKDGELIVAANYGIKEEVKIVKNKIILDVLKTGSSNTIAFPENIILDGILTEYKPTEIVIEPLKYNNIINGVLILAATSNFEEAFLSQLDVFLRSFSLVLNNSLQHEQMQKLAALDPLTGVYNRRFGLNRLNEEFSRSVRTNSPLGVMMIDIDKFKIVNDTYGHIAGDRVIKKLVSAAQQVLRNGDILVRYGGEEFLAILPGADIDNTFRVAERLRYALSECKTIYGDNEIKVTISIGVDSKLNSDSPDSLQLIKNADSALYSAKNTGRNRTIIFSDS